MSGDYKCIGVVDYGTGNLRSVEKAFIRIGSGVKILSSPDSLGDIDALVFPGQGTFDQCMTNLDRTGFTKAIPEWIALGKPFFGICLGLQVLFEESAEGNKKGLGIFPGQVKRFNIKKDYKIPHMGWNSVDWDEVSELPIRKGLNNSDQFYFVHSYHVETDDSSLNCLKTTYGKEFISGIIHRNCIATQFHPEKSQAKGLQIYQNFIEKVVENSTP